MKKDSKKKTLEEIYKEAREKEGPVIIPPQIDSRYYHFLLENESAEELGLLLKEYEKYKKLAKGNLGRIVKGKMIFGEPPEYYNPSEEEKRLSEIGNSIGRLLRKDITKESGIKMLQSILRYGAYADSVEYDLFNFYYVDVVGTGRFIYPSGSVKTSFSIIDMICDNIAQNEIPKQELEQIKNRERQDKDEIKKCFEDLLTFLQR